jgi:hypothetical protein
MKLEIKSSIGNMICSTPRNPSWVRTFAVVKAAEEDGCLFFLCRWTEKNPEETSSDQFPFNWFGAVHHKKSGIQTLWSIIGKDADSRKERDRYIETGKREIERFRCYHCNEIVTVKCTSRWLGPECVKITYTCPKCGYKDIDVAD